MKRLLGIFLALGCLAGPTTFSGALAAEYGPVKPGDTLYRIASQYRRPGVTVAQLMISIFESNPDAFEGGNINRLKRGAILQMPITPESVTVAPRQAQQQVSAQIGDYESDLRELRERPGELPPLASAPRGPGLDTGIGGVEPVVQAADPPPQQAMQDLAEPSTLPPVLPRALAQVELPEPKPASARPARPASAPFRWSYDVSMVADDNIRLARDADDIREDTIYSVMLKAQKGIAMGDAFSLFNYGGKVTYNAFADFDTLSNLEYEINSRYRFALASGFTAPIFSISAAIGGVDFDSEMRDSTILKLDLSMNKWLTNTINMTTGVGFTQRESVSEVFDMSETRLFVNFDTELSKTDLVYVTLTWITGDTASSATPSVDIINASAAIEPDDAFGGFASNQFAYRIEAESLVVTLGYNRILTSSLSMDLSARLVDSEATEDSEVYYERSILRASLLGRF